MITTTLNTYIAVAAIMMTIAVTYSDYYWQSALMQLTDHTI